jgi:site-specific recombinase XerD
MTKTNELTRIVQNFFSSHLPVERGLRAHTIVAYRDAMKLYLKYLAAEQRIPIHRIRLDHFTGKSVMGFIEDCAKARGNQSKTTNQRLAVLKSFFTYLMNVDPTRIDQYERVFHVKARRVPYRPVEYLERREMDAVLNGINRQTPRGRRDYAALLFLYNTGARAQELCDVKVSDLRLEKPCLAILHGKGNKVRHVPLWSETVQALRLLIDVETIASNANIFMNQSGEKLTRFGLRYILNSHVERAAEKVASLAKKKVGPHTIRHTTAMHLLQSGVDITVIKTWLGHVDLNTTHGYVEIDLKMKEAALEKVRPQAKRKQSEKSAKNEKDLIDWLESFGDM